MVNPFAFDRALWWEILKKRSRRPPTEVSVSQVSVCVGKCYNKRYMIWFRYYMWVEGTFNFIIINSDGGDSIHIPENMYNFLTLKIIFKITKNILFMY